MPDYSQGRTICFTKNATEPRHYGEVSLVRMEKRYPTDLSDAEWSYLEPHLPTPASADAQESTPIARSLMPSSTRSKPTASGACSPASSRPSRPSFTTRSPGQVLRSEATATFRVSVRSRRSLRSSETHLSESQQIVAHEARGCCRESAWARDDRARLL